MAWHTPKVDWVATDHFNIEDWERVRDNLIFINDWFKAHNWPSSVLQSMATSRGINALPSVQLVNRLEANLTLIHSTTGIPITEWRDSKTWRARLDALYNANPTYDDWNRWETLAKRLKESIDYVSTYLYQRISGTFYAGNNNNRIQHFSRGR